MTGIHEWQQKYITDKIHRKIKTNTWKLKSEFSIIVFMQDEKEQWKNCENYEEEL